MAALRQADRRRPPHARGGPAAAIRLATRDDAAGLRTHQTDIRAFQTVDQADNTSAT